MRNPFIVLLLILIGACQRDQVVGPLDDFYQRWHLIRYRPIQDTKWTFHDTDAYYDLEYRPDGAIVYRRNGASGQGNCCVPTAFTREGITIKYSDWVLCPTALCGTVKKTTITQLSKQSLELTDDYMVSQYEAVN
ncbi:hypothetical protein [Spirosoma panaciterrae]|uniref:hypothetical protein n=1 Tax=Spirosoma panaciterrae TaxID=496058 RepID=UPI0004778548|nr:hypothetical protein [Spirosoma panaciterrae]